MSKTLTAQISGHYYGCQVAQMLGKTQVVGLMVGLANDFIRIHTKGGSLSSWAMNNCKLVLTPLSAITDEHAVEVAEILMHPIPIKVKNSVETSLTCKKVWTGGYGLAVISPYFLHWVDKENNMSNTPQNHLAAFDYLRSKFYDCDSLIDAGIAISSLDLTEAK